MDRAPLDAQRLRARLGQRWSRIDVVEQTASTNADLLSDQSAPDHAVLVAEHQVAGRGRFARVWRSAPRAGLTFSIRVQPAVALPKWGWLPLLAGLALHEAAGEVTGIDTAVKWPNDLVTGGSTPDGGRKLAGILAQTGGDAVVIGIGLNVDTSEAELPVPTATSLRLAGAPDVDRTELLARVLERFDEWYGKWSAAAGDADLCGLRAAYRQASATVGASVVVRLGDSDAKPVRGRAADVDDSGRLVLDTADGVRVLAAGDVEQLRPS